MVVSEPRIIQANRYLDFGFGFYTTTNEIQAISFAEKVYRRKRSGDRVVNIYEIDETVVFENCSVLKFEAPNESWLDFVFQNRTGTYSGVEHDLIIGPVANDDVYTTFTLYASGVLSKEQTLDALKVKKLYDQLVFATDTALSFLHFKGTL